MLISETKMRELVRKALTEAADEDAIKQKAKELKGKIQGLSDEDALLLAKAKMEKAAGAGDESPAFKKVPEKGFGEWDKAGGDAFRAWMNKNHSDEATSMKLDPPSAKTSHTNKFIKSAYNASFEDAAGNETTYGEAWLASVRQANEEGAKGAEGRGDISTEEAFFTQREAQYSLYRKANKDNDEALKPIQARNLKSFYSRGMPIMYAYHKNEFDSGDGNVDDHKLATVKSLRRMAAANLDVAGRRAIGKKAGQFNYDAQEDQFAVIYDPTESTVYIDADKPVFFKGKISKIKVRGVPYENGKIMFAKATADAEAETAEADSEMFEAFDKLDAKSEELYTGLKRSLRTSFLVTLKEVESGTGTFGGSDETKMMKGIRDAKRAVDKYHSELAKLIRPRDAAIVKLGDRMPISPTDDDWPGDGSTRSPSGNRNIHGMWSGYYAVRDVATKFKKLDSKQKMIDYLDRSLAFGDFREMKKFFDDMLTEWDNKMGNRKW